MKRILSALIALALCGTASAETQQDKAERAAITDTAQTLIAVGSGLAAEGNPGGIAMGLLKYPLLKWCESLPKHEQPECFSGLNVGWSFAVANNWCVIGAVLLTGGTLAPICPMVGMAWAMNERDKAQAELEFWTICANLKHEYDEAHPGEPGMTCTYTPPVAEVRPAVLAAELPRISE